MTETDWRVRYCSVEMYAESEDEDCSNGSWRVREVNSRVDVADQMGVDVERREVEHFKVDVSSPLPEMMTVRLRSACVSYLAVMVSV